MSVRSNLEEASTLIDEQLQFFNKFETELSDIIAVLEKATDEDAAEICQDVAKRLNEFYHPL